MSDSDELEEILNQFRTKKTNSHDHEAASEGLTDDTLDADNKTAETAQNNSASADGENIGYISDTKESASADKKEKYIDTPDCPDDLDDLSLNINSNKNSAAPDGGLTESQPDDNTEQQDNNQANTPEASNDDAEGFVDISGGIEYAAEYPEENMSQPKNKKGIIIAVIAVIVVIAVAAGVYFGFIKKNDTQPTKAPSQTTIESTTAAPAIVNPLTGESDYNSSAVGKRPVACVVENSASARPQWGINSPDIIVEGEVEGGETRMLWIYADYTSVPDKIGPMRSARPPFIKFSELFDSIFIHWGQSKSKGSYVGAAEVFKQDNVDHINQMTYSGKTALYGRDRTRSVAVEHTGVLYGNKLKAAIDELGFRTEENESKYTKFLFNENATALSDAKCSSLSFKLSSRTVARKWTYSTEDSLYHCSDYKTDVEVKNLVVLYDKTEYVSKSNYKGSGKSETYCNYGLTGGKGVIASENSSCDITWSVTGGKLTIRDTSGNEVKLNPGRTWIGYGSSNNGGSVTQNAQQ